MSRLLQFVYVVALFSSLLIGACQTTRNESLTVAVPTEESPEDQALSKAVRGRLLADKKVDLTQVNVISNAGTVYLTGFVKSLDARQQAIKLAWEVRGVQSVVNSLEVLK